MRYRGMNDDKTLAWEIGYIISIILVALIVIAIIGAILFVLYPIVRTLFIFLYWMFKL